MGPGWVALGFTAVLLWRGKAEISPGLLSASMWNHGSRRESEALTKVFTLKTPLVVPPGQNTGFADTHCQTWSCFRGTWDSVKTQHAKARTKDAGCEQCPLPWPSIFNWLLLTTALLPKAPKRMRESSLLCRSALVLGKDEVDTPILLARLSN